MLLRLPPDLHYPIVVTRIQKRPNEYVKLDDPIFLYSYKSVVKEGSRYGDDEVEVEKKLVTQFKSTLEGTIRHWLCWEGDVIEAPQDVVEVEEECPHTMQFMGMCTNCGKDMTRVKPSSSTSNLDRAPVRMAHDTSHLTISRDEATKIDESSKKRLLAVRKLSLVVDLDQTIIHAAVDPTIGEWQKDPGNPNYEAVKDVRSFQLLDDGPNMRGCWYYIKLRPGLAEFLESISQLYELHIYTMGTRQYAKQISEIVDPEHKYFGDRILSRDESGSMVAKNLERLFPVDTKMVVIIDDRGDVWKWSANLIRVTPFDFFVGIGDINSSFLPKQQEMRTTQEALPKPEGEAEAVGDGKSGQNGEKVNGVAEDGTSTVHEGTAALETLIAMSGSDDPATRDLQNKSQEEIISTQLEEKPLLKMQQEQDEKDEKEAATSPTLEIQANGDSQVPQSTESESDSSESSASSQSSKQKARHSILKNDDEELIHLESSLRSIHSAFFREWDRKRLSGKGGRVAALAGKKKEPIEEDGTTTDLMRVPDVKQLLPSMKMRVLQNVTVVFSGVLPLGTDIQNADISTWAKTFGATVVEKVTKDVTHVIAARPGTAKVKQAIKRGIKVVGLPWLVESMQRWRKLDEKSYLLEGAGRQKFEEADENGDETVPMTAHDFLLSSSDDGSGPDTDGEASTKKKLKLDTTGAGEADDAEDFVEDHSPVTIDQAEWDDIDQELRDFLGSEAESESDAESTTSALSFREKRAAKRRRAADDDGDEERDERLKVPKSSRLKAVANAESESGGSTPALTNDEIIQDQAIAEEKQRADEAEADDSDDSLARALEEELEREDDG